MAVSTQSAYPRTVEATFNSPSYQAYQILHFAFVVAPIAAGLDKFFHILVNWDKYLAPYVSSFSPIASHSLMLIIGQLKEYSRERSREVKQHDGPPRGRVTKIFSDQGYGFITSEDGREIYFHRNSVLEAGFDRIEIGAAVWFNEEDGLEGPQASTVHLAQSAGGYGGMSASSTSPA